MSSNSLQKQVINSTIWTVAGYGSSQILRFGGNLILTRLLVPELFGLMALVEVFIRGLTLFSDFGIRPSIIKSDRGDDPVFLNTAWTIQIVRGFGLWLACALVALPISNYYDDVRFAWLIPIVGLNTIISGFNSTSIASLGRHLEVKKLALFELVVQIISLTILIIWAILSPSIWALVGGNLISIVIKVLFSHRLNVGKPNRFAWNKEVINEIISFGKWIFLSTAMKFLASQADRILLGKFLSLEILGIYVVAFTFADIPRQITLQISSKVIFPTISKLINRSRKVLKAEIIQKRWIILIPMICLVTVLVCFGDLIILYLYDSRYEQGAWMLPILALGLWPIMLCMTINPYLMAIGKPMYSASGNFLKFLYMLICLPLGFAKMGIIGAVIVIALNDIPFYFAVSYGLWREKLNALVQDCQATLLLIGLIILITTARFMLNFGFSLELIL